MIFDSDKIFAALLSRKTPESIIDLIVIFHVIPLKHENSVCVEALSFANILGLFHGRLLVRRWSFSEWQVRCHKCNYIQIEMSLAGDCPSPYALTLSMVMRLWVLFYCLQHLLLATLGAAQPSAEAAVGQFFDSHDPGASAHTNNWAVLVCASRYWFNYRVSTSIAVLTTPDRFLMIRFWISTWRMLWECA